MPGPQPTTARRRYVLALMIGVTVLNVVDRQLLSVLLDPIKRELGASDAQMGLLTGTAFALLHTVATIPVALWADRGVRRTIIAAGLALWSGLTALTGAARSFGEIFAIRVGVGIGEATGGTPAQSLLSDLFPLERRASALGALVAGGPLGSMIAFALGGLLADLYGWRTTFLIFGLPGILLALLIRFTVDEPARGGLEAPRAVNPDADANADAERHAPPPSVAMLAASPALRLLVLGSGLNTVSMYAILVWAVPYMTRVHGLSTTEAGARLALASGLCGALGSLAGGPLADRLARRELAWHAWVPACSAALAFPFGVGFALAPNGAAATWLLAPASFLAGCYFGPLYGAAQTVAGPHARALAGALVGSANAILGLGIAPPLVGWLTDLWTPDFGASAIRHSLALVLGFHLFASVLFLLAGFAMRSELADSERGAEAGPTRPS